MKALTPMHWLRIACVLAMVGLALMLWSLFDPHAQPILLALSLGQGIGTLSLALYVRVVVRDYRRGRSDDEDPRPALDRPAHLLRRNARLASRAKG